MKILTKISLTVALAIGVMVLNQCQEPEGKKSAAHPALTKQVGQQLSLTDANRWIDRYNKSAANARIAQASAVSTASVGALVDKGTDLGVVLHHALDEAGEYRLLIIPVATDGVLWGSDEALDASNGTVITRSTAQAWANNYMSQNPASVRYHFFGIEIFSEILSNERNVTLNIVPAINDNGEPQLVLIAKTQISANGRTNDEGDSTAYDFGRLCPPNCLQ